MTNEEENKKKSDDLRLPLEMEKGTQPQKKSLVVDDEKDFGPDRYLGYGARVGRLIGMAVAKTSTAVVKGSRYVAYSSDVGEAFRPVANPRWVRAGYGVAFAYVIGDTGWQANKARYIEGKDVTRTAAHTFAFHSVASIAAPSLIIHTQVHLVQKICQRAGRFQKWGPVIAGLALIPLLPFAVDAPLEHMVDLAFDKVWPENNKEKEKEKID